MVDVFVWLKIKVEEVAVAADVVDVQLPIAAIVGRAVVLPKGHALEVVPGEVLTPEVNLVLALVHRPLKTTEIASHALDQTHARSLWTDQGPIPERSPLIAPNPGPDLVLTPRDQNLAKYPKNALLAPDRVLLAKIAANPEAVPDLLIINFVCKLLDFKTF